MTRVTNAGVDDGHVLVLLIPIIFRHLFFLSTGVTGLLARFLTSQRFLYAFD